MENGAFFHHIPRNRTEPFRPCVKICGITNRQDAQDAIALGADALGFNFHPGSKRFLEFASAVKWIGKLPPQAFKVAVLVNAPLAEAQRIADHPAFDVIQLHGDEDAAYCAALPRGRFIKAVRLRDATSLEGIADFSTDHILLDADAGAAFGGTGKKIDLALAAQVSQRHPGLTVILAGGLTPDNVAEAVRAVRPFAVDVASGVESAPGRKDRGLVRAFIEAVASAATVPSDA